MRPNKYKKGPKSIETGHVVGVFESQQTEAPDNAQNAKIYKSLQFDSMKDKKIKGVESANKRYIIVDGSISAHCCFQYTIVDTAAGKKSYGDYWKRSMCETFERAEAEEICNALNIQNQKQ